MGRTGDKKQGIAIKIEKEKIEEAIKEIKGYKDFKVKS